jgi:hypothetical protein
MKISDEQVRRAVEYLQTTEESCAEPLDPHVSSECIERARAVIDITPDVRDDRLDSAREMLSGVHPSSGEVAEKMIGRIISDSLR